MTKMFITFQPVFRESCIYMVCFSHPFLKSYFLMIMKINFIKVSWKEKYFIILCIVGL